MLLLSHWCFVSALGGITHSKLPYHPLCTWFAGKHPASALCTIGKGDGSVSQQLFRPSSGFPGEEFSPISDLTDDVIAGTLQCEAKHECIAV